MILSAAIVLAVAPAPANTALLLPASSLRAPAALVQRGGRASSQRGSSAREQDGGDSGGTGSGLLDRYLPERRERNNPYDPAPILETYAEGDLDGDDRLSFREGNQVFSLSASAFRKYDKDKNGWIEDLEFVERVIEIRRKGGRSPSVSKRLSERSLAVPREAEQLKFAFDDDLDGLLSMEELQNILTEYQRTDLDPEVLIRRCDIDESNDLNLVETESFVPLLYSKPDIDFITGEKEELESEGSDFLNARSIEELFGTRVPRVGESDANALPDFIAGPVDSFYRLDADGDNRITVRDLELLKRPIQVSAVRIKALIAILDIDGDDGISREEFWDSMR
ncbi:MAG: EF-hand domain-containing protein [Planctomycetota bacterium]